jgi:DNA polymerase III subunit gamma/tau
MMFYRKYRPQKFSEISKPNEVASALMKQLQQEKVGHAYLFSGPRGTGKTTTARIFAKALNCKKLDETGDPCNKCDVCKSVQSGNFIDLIEIDAASNRGIDDIRELKDKIKLSPSASLKKIYIIDEVHMLTTEAFNALLKTLEEPPSHAVFLLCTTELHKVPDTIKSRCQVFKFKRATISQLVERLSDISKSEKYKIDKEDLRKIAEASLGGFRDAETLLQQVIEGDMNIEELLNIGSVQNYSEFVDLLGNDQADEAIRLVNKVHEDGVDLYIWTGELIKFLRDLLLISSGADEGLVDVTEDLHEKMKLQAEEMGSAKIVTILEAFVKAHNLIKNSFITQLPIELAIVEVCEDVQRSGGLKNQRSVAPDDGNAGRDDKGALKNKTNTDKKEPEEQHGGKESVNEEIDIEVIDISIVEDKWEEILEKVIAHNNSIQALLKTATPVSSESGSLIIEVSYAFHKERLESPKNRKIVEGVFSEVLGSKPRLKFAVSKNPPVKENLTDYNVVIPSRNTSEDNPLDIFDGGLPLR